MQTTSGNLCGYVVYLYFLPAVLPPKHQGSHGPKYPSRKPEKWSPPGTPWFADLFRALVRGWLSSIPSRTCLLYLHSMLRCNLEAFWVLKKKSFQNQEKVFWFELCNNGNMIRKRWISAHFGLSKTKINYPTSFMGRIPIDTTKTPSCVQSSGSGVPSVSNPLHVSGLVVWLVQTQWAKSFVGNAGLDSFEKKYCIWLGSV